MRIWNRGGNLQYGVGPTGGGGSLAARDLIGSSSLKGKEDIALPLFGFAGAASGCWGLPEVSGTVPVASGSGFVTETVKAFFFCRRQGERFEPTSRSSRRADLVRTIASCVSVYRSYESSDELAGSKTRTRLLEDGMISLSLRMGTLVLSRSCSNVSKKQVKVRKQFRLAVFAVASIVYLDDR